MYRIAVVVAMALFLGACAGGIPLRTQDMRAPVELSGTFDVVLYLAPQYDFLETVAILDVAGDGYEIVPLAPEFEYQVLEELSAEDSMEEALHFVGHHRDFSGSTRTRRIESETGETIGYEFRPLYQYFVYGMMDVLDIHYYLEEEGKVWAVIDLDERLKRMLEDGDDGPDIED